VILVWAHGRISGAPNAQKAAVKDGYSAVLYDRVAGSTSGRPAGSR
jgi:hypothetical protein